MCDRLKVVIEVIVQELQNKKFSSQTSDQYIDNYTFELPKDLSFNGIYKNNIVEYVKELEKKARDEIKEENRVEYIIYRCLCVIYQNSSQQERFLHLQYLLEYLYDKLVQRINELREYTLILSKNEFIKTVRTLLPHIKVSNVKSLDVEESQGSVMWKEALVELCELALYPRVLREDCYEVIKSKVCIQNKTFLNYEVKAVESRSGFLCDYLKVRISITDEDHFFFVKCMPLGTDMDASRRDLIDRSFRKEEMYYRQFIPSVTQIVSPEMTNFLPRSYYSVHNQFIVMDDATAYEYSNLDKNIPLNYDEVMLIVKQLAKMHAASMIYEERMSKILKKPFRAIDYYEEMLNEAMDINQEQVKTYMECNIRTINYLFEKCKDRFKDIDLEDTQKKVRSEFYKMFEVTKPSNDCRNFVTHGDLWCNNIVFKNDHTSCLLLDLQMVRYCSPVYDVCTAISMNADQDTRQKYSQKIADEYYVLLKEHLCKYGINVDTVFSHKRFLEEFEDYISGAMLRSTGLLTLILPPREEIDAFLNKEAQNVFSGDRRKVVDLFWNVLDGRLGGLLEDLYSRFKNM